MNPNYESRLMKIIGFKEGDLTVNRDGKLTDSQISKLRAERQGWVQRAGVALGIASFFFATIVFDAGFKPTDKFSNATVICVLLAVALLYAWLKWSRYNADIKHDRVYALIGKLEPYTYLSRGIRYYKIFVDDVDFPSDKKLFEVLSN